MNGWTLERGAHVRTDGVEFAVWAPKAERVDVVLESGPATGIYPLARGDAGVYAGFVAGAGAGDDYRYRLDGGDPLPDPVSRYQPEGVHGASQVVDPSAFAWSDAGWRGRAMADLVLYELHVGTFTAEGTFEAAIARLDYLRDLGVTAVELMPVAQTPGVRNWGYDGVGLYAPQNTYGGPGGLRRFVDAAHARGLAVVLDVVYNHLGPEGDYLARFGPYFTERYRTPWGPAVNYDDAGSDEVRRFVIDNALYWATEFHVDGLRLDAVHGIYDFGAYHILEELAAEVRRQGERLGRPVLLIAESDLNDPKLVRVPERCGYGLDAQWSDDFHHAAHAVLTGEDAGYYGDFGEVGHLALALAERFVYAGRHSGYRGRRHGARALDVPADRFVVAVQNHDQVGNRARGERLGALVSNASQRLAAALLLVNPYVPLLFMGEEYGETNPFLYFVDPGDPELARAVRDGRREEFRHFGWSGEIPDPADPATFERSKLDWAKPGRPPHAGLLALYRDLLVLRRSQPALRPGASVVDVHFDESAGWIQVSLTREGEPAILAVFNFTARDETRIPLRIPGTWDLVLSTDDTAYGGQGVATYDGTLLTLPDRGAGVFLGARG
ncbi:MAG TPA: malto-oligosyltrehalose trehalohydrolase [Gemmatimonadales bacterium]|nr:malto-oligosyltrehalose trehalohydrolase [Gemmatimonadales bacterium]